MKTYCDTRKILFSGIVAQAFSQLSLLDSADAMDRDPYLSIAIGREHSRILALFDLSMPQHPMRILSSPSPDSYLPILLPLLRGPCPEFSNNFLHLTLSSLLSTPFHPSRNSPFLTALPDPIAPVTNPEALLVPSSLLSRLF